jgi:hypothetical protein
MKTIAVAILFTFTLIFGLTTSGCLDNKEPITKRSKVYERSEFSKAVISKPMTHVKNLIGSPDEVQKSKDSEVWRYRHLTYWSSPSRLDRDIWISFSRDGTVARIYHEDHE